MITGRDALFSVEQAITQARVSESRLDNTLQSAMAEAERLRRAEAEGFRMLARVRLDAIARKQVIGEIDATERRALDMIQKHRELIDALARRRDQLQAELEKAEAAKHDRDQELAQAMDALDQLRRRTADRIKGDAAWRAAKEASDAAERVAANADQKASLSEADLAAKRKPYEDDPLFIYLWRKKHGQTEDTSNRFVLFFDRKVAYLDTAKVQLAGLERRALVADGVEGAEARVESGHAARKAAEEAVTKTTAELQQVDAERQRAVGSGADAVMAGAVDLLAEGMARDDLRKLYQEALQTPSKEDERAVEAISQAREALRKADAEVGQIRSEIRELAKRRVELEGARDRARRIGYDNPMGTFPNQDDIAGTIGAILEGVLRGTDLDRVLRDNYRRPQRRVPPDFGGGPAGSWPGPAWPGPTWPGPAGDVSGDWSDTRAPGGGDDTDWRTGGRF